MTHGSLALKLRVLRAERALTIEQAASLAGVTPETVSDAERGRRRPYLPTLRKLAAAYGVPVGELLASEAEEPEAALAASGKAEPAQDAGPAKVGIDLEQLHGDRIHSGPHDTARLGDFLNGKPLTDMDEECQRFARLVAFVLTTTEYLDEDQWQAVHEDVRRKLAPPSVPREYRREDERG
jgi:transcriptional regulator with XRE-family HTH domain